MTTHALHVDGMVSKDSIKPHLLTAHYCPSDDDGLVVLSGCVTTTQPMQNKARENCGLLRAPSNLLMEKENEEHVLSSVILRLFHCMFASLSVCVIGCMICSVRPDHLGGPLSEGLP